MKFNRRWFLTLLLALAGCGQPVPSRPTLTASPNPTNVSSMAISIRVQPTRAATIGSPPRTPVPPTPPLEFLPPEVTAIPVRTSEAVPANNLRVVKNKHNLPLQSSAANSEQDIDPTITSVLSGITPHAHIIFQRGQRLGNRANVFSKVGDSLTVATYVLYPIGWGGYQLHEYERLAPVITYFSAADARDGNSFLNISLAADNGWTSESLLNPALTNVEWCLPGESPLHCEFRVVRPATALILIGTNDVAELSIDSFESNLRRIIDLSATMGVIPVVSTLPNREGFEAEIEQFNAVIRDVTREFGIPLWDYGDAMSGLPNGGLSLDGVHPSWPPDGFDSAADFSEVNLQYGYTLRNLTALEVLDTIWKQVLLD
ncbi:MAG: hypothetical protein K8J31_29445 [Anaerolineae bacterium]|nr:hypothetical protein [Anaerolineae bacterium]